MTRWRYGLAALALGLAACGQPQAPTAGEYAETPVEDVTDYTPAPLPPVEAALLAAATSEFTAIEPSEVGVQAAASVEEALAPLLSPESAEEGASLQYSVRESGDDVIADIVRTNIPDDSVAAGHVRIEFRREPEGWFPTNAYRRSQCRRGDAAGQWTTGLCP